MTKIGNQYCCIQTDKFNMLHWSDIIAVGAFRPQRAPVHSTFSQIWNCFTLIFTQWEMSQMYSIHSNLYILIRRAWSLSDTPSASWGQVSFSQSESRKLFHSLFCIMVQIDKCLHVSRERKTFVKDCNGLLIHGDVCSEQCWNSAAKWLIKL